MAPLRTDSGIGTKLDLPYTHILVIDAFLAIAWYNVVELTIIMQTFFKRYSGLYYWSLMVANWGTFFHALGMFLKFFKINDSMKGHTVANTVIVWVGWCMMVTGQSIVLWSRIHLVAQASWTRWILIMIIADAIVLHTTTGVLTFFTNIANNPRPYEGPYSIVEKIQVSIFFVQEVILSGVYIWKTSVMLRNEGSLFSKSENVRGTRGKKVLRHTIVMSVIIICLDITLIALEFSGLYDIQTSYKGAVYSVKLKMEFTILNSLMNLVKGNLRDSSSNFKSGSKSHTYPRPTSHKRTSIRPSEHKGLGHSAGAYARMDDNTNDGADVIKLQNLKCGDVLRTTTTEVRVDKITPVDGIGCSMDDKHRASASSSEVYIIAQNKAS